MSAFDTLDRGLEAFLAQEGAAIVPPTDLVDDLLSRTAARHPHPAWVARLRGAGTGSPIASDGRLLAVALVAVGLIALAIVAAIAGGQPRPRLVEVAVPSPAAASAQAQRADGLPDAMFATWVADAGPIPTIGATGPRLRLVLPRSGGTIGIGLDDGALALRSTMIQPRSAGELRLILQRADGGCVAGAEGFYRYTTSPDGVLLTLATEDEQCAARRVAFARTWTRSLTGDSNGGTGVVDAFEPPFLVTLPGGEFTGTTYTDAVEVDRGDPALNLFAFKDPQGFTDPCAQDGGSRRLVAPGADAFAAYVRSIPGFNVTPTELEIDGHRALHLGVTQSGPAMCTGERVVEWQAKAETGTLNWIIGIGDPDSMYVVELPNATVLLQVIGPTHVPGPTADERAIVDTVRFLEALPSTR